MAVRIGLLRDAVAKRPRSAGLRFDLAECLLEADEEEAAVECYRLGALLAPGSRFPGDRMAKALVRQRIFLPQALAGLALNCGLAGEESAVRNLVDYDRFVYRSRPPVPHGYTRAQFFAALAEELRQNMTYYAGGGREPTTKAWQNDTIMEATSPAWIAYLEVLKEEIEHYIAQLPQNSDHPFLAARPQEHTLDAHALITRDGGFIGPHFHPRAWITCVFYVVSPSAARQHGSQQGWLSLEPPPGYEDLPGWDTRLLEPEQGSLVIMPGYFFHSTRPVEHDEERISLIVDVMDRGFPMRTDYGPKAK